VTRGGPRREEAHGEGGVPSSGRLEHVASFGGLNSAPTHANTFVPPAISVEIRIRAQGRKEGTAVRKGGPPVGLL